MTRRALLTAAPLAWPALALVLLASATLPAGAAAGPRVVGVADLHGDWDHAVDILRAAGLAEFPGDAEGIPAPSPVSPPFEKYRGVRWVGGDAALVQTGDLVDRGDYARDLYALFAELRRQAPLQGGRVVNLIGNHELMNLMGDLRYVSPGDNRVFGGEALRKKAWSAGGALAEQILSEFEPFAVVHGTAFVHAGMNPADAKQGPEALRSALLQAVRDANTGRGMSKLLQSSGPFWVRRFAEGNEANICPLLDQTLEYLGAQRMVVGHTQVEQGRVHPRCGGKLLMADTIISKNGYPMCWQEGSAARAGCEASSSYVEVRDGSAFAVRLLEGGGKEEVAMPLPSAADGPGAKVDL